MGLDSNVIDGRGRFGRKASATGSVSLEERLSRTARVPESDRPLLALNLGKLAARIDQDSPLRGAKRIIEETGNEGLWPKRKRFIRLPGEGGVGCHDDAVLGASGSTFAQLAKAAGRLLATSKSREALDDECERALRATLEGTSFLPSFAPLSSSDRTAKTLLDEYADILADAVAERTRITDLWRVLRESPFGLHARREDEPTLDLSSFGERARFPEELLRPIFRPNIVEAVFDPRMGGSSDWAEPTLEIGFMAMRFSARIFAVPEEVGHLFQREREDDDGHLTEAKRWLESLRAAHNTRGGVFPNQPYQSALGYGWKPFRISVLKHVGLTIARNDEGEPKLRLSTWGYDGVGALNPGGIFSADAYEDRVAACRGEISQLWWIDLDENTPLYAVHEVAFDRYNHGEAAPRVLGLLDYHWLDDYEIFDMAECGWSETPATAFLLFGDEHRFIPALPACDPVPGPVRKGTVGAALLHNARSATEEESIPRLLIERARLTADAGLRFHESMVEHYREALRRI